MPRKARGREEKAAAIARKEGKNGRGRLKGSRQQQLEDPEEEEKGSLSH